MLSVMLKFFMEIRVLSITSHRHGAIESAGQERGCGRRPSRSMPASSLGFGFLATLPPWPSGCDWPFRHSRAPFGDSTAGLDRTRAVECRSSRREEALPQPSFLGSTGDSPVPSGDSPDGTG